ncbi:MAG: AMP-binding protein [Actinomycetota bacterium]|nr:AMP-binding protein [Actinomycetota bacterium]
MTFAVRSLERTPIAQRAGLPDLIWLRSLTSSRQVYLERADGGQRVTYGELCRVAARWSALLFDLDVRPGATVGVAVAEPVEFAAVFLGVLASGRTAAPLDPSATDAELTSACARSSPRVVVADRRAPEGVRAEWLTLPPGACFLSGTPCAALRTPSQHAGGVVLSTSGTTGTAKVIRLGEAQLLHTARAVAGHLELSSQDRGFNPLPLFHINAEVVGLLATLVSGATLVLDDRFHRRGFWETMARRRVTWINAVPAILARLAALEGTEDVPEAVRFARSASAPLPVPVLERFEKTTGIPIVETYGMTEAASQITANPLHGPRKSGSAGVAVGTEVRVVAGEREVLGPNEVGRVVIRGPSVIAAYASPGYEDRVDRDGWLETGDLGYLDPDGYLFLVGRADDVINRGGEKIYPKELEDVVLSEPDVTSAAVVGWDHQVLGRVPVAYLVVEGVRGPQDEARAVRVVTRVHARCAEVLSRAKRPVAYHVVERMPQGATGKVRRSALSGVPAVYSLLVR